MDVTAVQQLSLTADFSHLISNAAAEAARRGRTVVASLVHRIRLMDVLSLFRQAQHTVSDRFFYARPGEGFILAGFGAASVITSVGTARFRQAATVRRELLMGARVEGARGLSGVGPLFFGGFSFDPLNTVDPQERLWAGFSDGRLVMPKLLYTQRGEDAYLSLNVLVEAECDPAAEADALIDLWQSIVTGITPDKAAFSTARQQNAVAVDELRTAAEWKSAVAYAAARVRREELDKVVLARAVHARIEEKSGQRFDVAVALETLLREYPDTHIFAIVQGQRTFLAATPERLARLRRGELLTMSLAGSSRRGSTAAEDESLGSALLRSNKDRHEHSVVVQEIAEGLRGLVDSLTIPTAPSLLRLKNVQHLCTPITGYLIEDYTLLDVVERLHPTPAVGGHPRAAALALIREHEQLDRGWYAAPVGWIDDKGDGEFVVALRSALVQPTEAFLFAGCGIMADSDPDREYAESNLKLRPMLTALTEAAVFSSPLFHINSTK